MSTINIDLAADTILNVMIGQQDENEVREVVFDFSGWYTTYGSGTISLAIQRPKDEWPYEGTLTVDSTNHEATWEISDTDTAYAGTGQIQLSYTVGDAVKKSVVYRFTCHKSLGALGSVVTPIQIQTFIDEVEEELQTMDGKLDDMEDEIADVKADLGDLSELETTDKSNLVSAINEAAQSGGSGTGLTEDMKQALLACFNNVAWKEDDDGELIDALEEALYPPANLTRITAVYTQSGTVTNWNTLDDLKADLVVTAHFDNGTSETVSNYALSGSLVAPSSTITVTYGGKTTTFTVNVTESKVPTGYTAYDYLTQTLSFGASHNAYAIITDAVVNSDNTIEFEFCFPSTIQSNIDRDPVIGSRNGNNGTFNVAYYPSAGRVSSWNLFGTSLETSQMYRGTRYNIKYLPVGKSETYPDNNVISVNGTEKNTNLAVTGSTSMAWFGIFGYAVAANTSTSNTNYFRGEQIGEIKIYDSNDDVIYDFIPAKDSSDRYGYLETVNKRFYYNSTHATDGYTGGDWSDS